MNTHKLSSRGTASVAWRDVEIQKDRLLNGGFWIAHHVEFHTARNDENRIFRSGLK